MSARPRLDPMQHYGNLASSAARHDELLASLRALLAFRGHWAQPMDAWLDNLYDSVAQREIYRHVAPAIVDGGVVLQVGGTGKEALKALIGGASSAYHVTPVAAEAELTRRLAGELGVADSLTVLVAPGERLPLPDASVDAYLSERCLHHTSVPDALREARRVLRVGGLFGAADPWRARLHGLSRAVFDRQQPGLECRPLDRARLASLPAVFPDSRVHLHGAIVRYPVIALLRMGIPLRRGFIHKATELDDRISAHVEVLRRNGSSAAVLATA